MLGNVKAFILFICGAVVFAILLVSANTMAMSIRERTREVAVLKTLGFTRKAILVLFVGEAVALAVIGGLLGSMGATGLVSLILEWAACSQFTSEWTNHGGGDGGGLSGGLFERVCSFVSCFADGHRGWFAAHRVAGYFYF